MIDEAKRAAAHGALRAAGFSAEEAFELLGGQEGLRDKFAGQAMPIAAEIAPKGVDYTKYVAHIAYGIADAMMIERGLA